METIVCLIPLTEGERQNFEAAAAGRGWEILFRPDLGACSAEELARITIVQGNPQAGALAGLPKLKWLQTSSAGVDAYQVPGVLPEGVWLTSAVGAYGPAVSEHMLAGMLALMKRLPAYRDHQNARLWEKEGDVKSPDGAVVLVLGTGDLGSHFARLTRGLGSYTIGLSRHPEKEAEGFDELRHIGELDKLIGRADVVASTLPGGPETYHILDRARLWAMKPGAILVNAGRGSVVDCLALAQALKEGRLWGAALDVTEPEPLPANHPLWDCPSLLLTPHTAGGNRMERTVHRVAAIVLDNLRRYAAGDELRNRYR